MITVQLINERPFLQGLRPKGAEAFMRTVTKIAACVTSVMLFTTPAMAQQTSTNKVAEKTDWSVFVETNPKECWSVSQPKETVNTRNGRVVAVRRGEILLYTFYRPSDKVNGQVAFTGGYPFAKDSTVTLSVGSTTFNLFTQGDWAWAASDADDDKIIAAMKRGAKATLVGRSSKGTKTEDSFSLSGFTAAVEDAEKRCK